MATTSGSEVKPNAWKIIEMLIGSDPVVDRLSLQVADTECDVFSGLEGRYRSHHAAGTTVIARLNHGKYMWLRRRRIRIRIHVLSVYTMRSR
ncbi:MAG: hypothetical protein MK110_14990 [Fuerstiella sp.]|nr:hypothetical protein [Fuerstiella sp.]